MTKKNLNFIRTYYEDSFSMFLNANKKEYCQLFENKILDIDDVIDNEYEHSYQVLIEIIKNTKSIDIEKKIALFANSIEDLDKEQIKEIFEILSMNDFLEPYKGRGHNSKISKSDINEKILDKMKTEWGFTVNKDYDEQYYYIYGRDTTKISLKNLFGIKNKNK